MSTLEYVKIRTPLTQLFNTANSKVLDFLLIYEGLQYSESEISKLANIPTRTLHRSLQLLLKEEIIKRTKKNRRVYYYTANLSSPRVSGLLSYMTSTMLENVNGITEKHQIKN